jgi:hypothetical protein
MLIADISGRGPEEADTTLTELARPRRDGTAKPKRVTLLVQLEGHFYAQELPKRTSLSSPNIMI